jgi:hypothetical protein
MIGVVPQPKKGIPTNRTPLEEDYVYSLFRLPPFLSPLFTLGFRRGAKR